MSCTPLIAASPPAASSASWTTPRRSTALRVQREPAGGDARGVQQVLDDVLQRARAAVHDLERAGDLVRIGAALAEQAEPEQHRSEGRPQLVREQRQEVVLQVARLLRARRAACSRRRTGVMSRVKQRLWTKRPSRKSALAVDQHLLDGAVGGDAGARGNRRRSPFGPGAPGVGGGAAARRRTRRGRGRRTRRGAGRRGPAPPRSPRGCDRRASTKRRPSVDWSSHRRRSASLSGAGTCCKGSGAPSAVLALLTAARRQAGDGGDGLGRLHGLRQV